MIREMLRDFLYGAPNPMTGVIVVFVLGGLYAIGLAIKSCKKAGQ